MSAFGPVPIPSTPNAVQASFIAQHAAGARPREKNTPQEAESTRGVWQGFVRDVVKISDPQQAQAVDSKPDAVEEWKHHRGGRQHHDPRFAASEPRRTDGPDEHTLDIKA